MLWGSRTSWFRNQTLAFPLQLRNRNVHMIRYPQNYKTKMDQNNFKELFLVDKIQMWFNPQEDLWDAVLFQTVPVKTPVSLKTGPALYFALVSCIYNTTSVQQRKCLTIKFKCTQFYSWKCMSNNKRDKKKPEQWSKKQVVVPWK